MFNKTIIKNKAFTLVEMLVVIAITAVLMGLVMGPLIQSFKLTRSAETLVEAQDSARSAMTQIDRDLSEAMFVFDNTPYIDSSNNPQNTIALPVYRTIAPSPTNFYLDYAKLDMIQPKMTAHCINPDHPAAASRDFPRDIEESGKRHVLASPECPACKTAGLDPLQVEIRPKLPIEQDVVIVRYFLGLMHNDPTQTDFGWKPQMDSNHVVIYRLEINPNDPLLFDPALNLSASAKAAIYNAPDFFYSEADSNDLDENGDKKPLWKYWAEHATTIGIYKKQDLVSYVLDTDKAVKSIEPTVNFRFKHIDYDTLIGAYTTDKSFDYPTTIPAVFRAAHGYWTPGCTVVVYRNDETIAYTVDVDRNPATSAVINKSTYAGSWSAPVDQFDITEYLKNGTVPTNAEMAFTIDLNRGAVNFSIVPPKPTGVTSSVSPFDPAFINNDFKYHYNGTNGFIADPGTARRRVKLSTIDNTYPNDPAILLLTGNQKGANYLANARVVPGSETIVGPDYYASNIRVKYERVPYGLGDPGPNQYKIDYDEGYVEFNSSYDQDIPEVGLIDVNYLVHFNKPGDVVKASYSTKSIIETHLGMRIIDSGTTKMIAVDLNGTTEVGNAIR